MVFAAETEEIKDLEMVLRKLQQHCEGTVITDKAKLKPPDSTMFLYKNVDEPAYGKKETKTEGKRKSQKVRALNQFSSASTLIEKQNTIEQIARSRLPKESEESILDSSIQKGRRSELRHQEVERFNPNSQSVLEHYPSLLNDTSHENSIRSNKALLLSYSRNNVIVSQLRTHLKNKKVYDSICDKFKREDAICSSASKVVQWKKRAKFLPLSGVLELNQMRNQSQMLQYMRSR